MTIYEYQGRKITQNHNKHLNNKETTVSTLSKKLNTIHHNSFVFFNFCQTTITSTNSSRNWLVFALYKYSMVPAPRFLGPVRIHRGRWSKKMCSSSRCEGWKFHRCVFSKIERCWVVIRKYTTEKDYLVKKDAWILKQVNVKICFMHLNEAIPEIQEDPLLPLSMVSSMSYLYFLCIWDTTPTYPMLAVRRCAARSISWLTKWPVLPLKIGHPTRKFHLPAINFRRAWGSFWGGISCLEGNGCKSLPWVYICFHCI